MDQRLHRLLHDVRGGTRGRCRSRPDPPTAAPASRPSGPRSSRGPGSASSRSSAWRDDPQRLAHLVDPDRGSARTRRPRSGPARRTRTLVPRVRHVLAQVGRDPGARGASARSRPSAQRTARPSRTPTPSFRSRQIGLSFSSVSYSSIRAGSTSRSCRSFDGPSSGRSITTPPIRMYAWFIRSPVIASKMSRIISRSRRPYSITETAPISSPPVASHTRCEEMRFSSQTSTRINLGALGAPRRPAAVRPPCSTRAR